MYFKVVISAVSKKLRTAGAKVGEPGNILFGRQGGGLMEVDCGHAGSYCRIAAKS
jgi:hypothetical protein